ncbi:hypothetical protein T09_14153 [Trichinella sp. T9]|nr:hypothetical protein T09_14153 [Trichinella sp. T9]
MISADLEAKLLFKHKSLSEFWSNVSITTKYLKLSATAQPFLLAFPSSYLPRKCDFIKAKEQTEPGNAWRLAPETH